MESTTRYNPRYVVPYNNPDRRAPGETVNKIFLKAASGRFSDIMNAIIQEKSLLNLFDPQNRSIIHHILLNGDLSKIDKYNLIKKSAELGAPIDTPELINGVRPIHLASGQQNRKVVRYLLSKKADPNSKTYNFMTPLHYAVNPDTVPCPTSKSKSNLFDTSNGAIFSTQEFYTDSLFNAVFELFKKDQRVLKYIKHIADIFRYRFVYNDSENDTKELTKIIKDTLGERKNDLLNEKVQNKLIDFRNTIYTKTRSDLSQTNSRIDIKEDTPNGWAPMYRGSHDAKLAILPFTNLKYAFTELYDGYQKSSIKSMQTIISQYTKTLEYVNSMKTYLISINETIAELKDVDQILNLWSVEIDAHFKNDGRVAALINVFDRFFSKNGIMINNRNVPTITFENINNFNDDVVPLSKLLTYKGKIKHTYFNDVNTTPNNLWTGIGVILEHYFININNKLNNLGEFIKQIEISINKGMNMDQQLDTFTNVGDFQYYLLNICYTLVHFDYYAKKLSNVLENFKSLLVEQNLQPIVNYVSTIINTCIDFIDDPQQQPNNFIIINNNGTWTNGPPIKKFKYGNVLILCYKDINNINNNYVFIKGAPMPNRNNKGRYPSGSYSVRINNVNGVTYNTYVRINGENYIRNSNMLTDIVKSNLIDIANNTNKNTNAKNNLSLVDKLTKSIEAGGINNEGKIGNENLVNKIYSSLVDLQTKMNTLMITYNSANGYIFTNKFNNNMNDVSYNNPQSDIFAYMMFNKVASLKTIPNTFTQFFEKYKHILYSGGRYTSANAFNTVKTLIDTYGVKINRTSKTMIVRQRKISDNPVTIEEPEELGIISEDLKNAPTSTLRQGINGIKVGSPEQLIGNYQINKFTDSIEKMSIIGSVFDEHIYMIKLILLMYMAQRFANIYDAGKNGVVLTGDRKSVYSSMNDLVTQIDTVSSVNSLGTVLAIAVKMVDDIYLSTIDNISNLSASNYIRYLATQQEIKNVPFNTLLANASTLFPTLDIKSQLIVKPDAKVVLRGKDMVLSVMSRSLLTPGSLDADMLNIFKVNHNDDNTDTDTHTIINYDSIDINNNVCYNVDEDIVGDLLAAGADSNIIARSGETPLSLAITIQNENIIETLLRSGSKVGKNNNDSETEGKNLYNMCFNQLLNLIDSSPVMEIDDINTIVESHLQKVSGMQSMFTNSKLIMGMTAYMFIHQLTLMTNTYPNMWTHNDQVNILSMLNLINVDKDFIPLAKLDLSLIDENLQGYSTLNDVLDEYRSKLIEARETYIRIDNSIKNLDKELKELGSNDAYRRSEITELVKELTNQLNHVESRIKELTKLMENARDIVTGKSSTALTNIKAVNKTKIAIQGSSNLHRLITAISKTKTRDVCNVYNVFFNTIISTNSTNNIGEYDTYIKLWNNLLARPEEMQKTDHTQMIGILMQYISSNGVIDPEMFVNIYSPICDLYDKVLVKYSRDLFELMPYLSKDGESYYESNYVLKQIYCIMNHVFKHTMSINFITTISQLLVRRDKGKTDSVIIKNVYQAMKSSGFNKYVLETLPKLVIKIVCKIYESEKDPDLSLTVTDALNKSLDRLLLSTFESIDKSTVEQAKEIVVPYFVSYMETYTAEMYKFMIKQCKMMIIQGRLLRILKMLAPKAILEKGVSIY